MKYWMAAFCLFTCLLGCSPQDSSTIDAQLAAPAEKPGQGKPIVPADWPYFDWAALGDISAMLSDSVQVTAGGKQYSDANLLVSLRGSAQSLGEHPIVQVRWWQVSGPPAVIANPNQLRTQVLLPEVAQPVTAIFRFAAINAIGEVDSAQVPVVIRPLTAPLKVTAAGVAEEDSELTFWVSLAQPATELITFEYSTEDDSARAGEDYLTISGTLTFHPGQTHQPISVRLLQDNTPEAGEVFYLRLRGELAGEPVELRRMGLILDQQAERNLLSSVPQAGFLSADTTGLPGQNGDPRLLLRWQEGGMVRLVVEDPCGNTLLGAQAIQPCQGTSPLQQTGTLAGSEFAYFENMAWTAGAAAGTYRVFLEHVAGQAVDYGLNVYGLDAATRYSGVMANGERVEVTALLLDGMGNPTGNRITGSIVNATNTAPVEGGRVRFYQGEMLVAEQVAAASFNIPLAAGTYRMSVTAAGYVEWTREVTITAAEPLAVQVSLSPVLNSANELARVVLTWGEVPADLDSHLLSLGKFHLFFNNKDVGTAVLDVDDTNSFGPETVTIRSWESGIYRYYIRDFSAGGNTTSLTLANSNAVVQLYLGSENAQVFQVPEGAGVLWHVFDLDPATGEVTVINRIVEDEAALQEVPASGE